MNLSSPEKIPPSPSSYFPYKLSEYKRTQLINAFNVFDSKSRGAIDTSHLKLILSSLGLSLDPADFAVVHPHQHHDSAPSSSDMNTDNVSLSAYLTLMTKKYSIVSTEFDTRHVFSILSSQVNGKITLESIQKALVESDVQMTDAELAAVIREFDDDGDGALSAEEFKVVMDELVHM